MCLTALPPDARLREELLALGPGSLADPELFAPLLRSGSAAKSMLHVTQELQDCLSGLAGLLKAGSAALTCIQGLGRAKRAAICAALEMTVRRSLGQDASFAESVLL